MSSHRSRSVYFLRSVLIASCVLLTGSALAQMPSEAPGQTPSTLPATSEADEGKQVGDFHVTQSIEFGGRITSVSGSQPMYDTLLDYQTGARILDQSLTMQSTTHQDLFDTLTLSSFGWGGDPEQAARVRIAKYGWYTFIGTYQHFQNYFDYDLLANPLNPATGTTFVPILNSPHGYYNRQNLYNFGFVALPMHRLSFRIDYNRNRFIGPSFSSLHTGTEALLNQTYNNTLNGYRFGVDFRATKKTTISYTQLFQSYNGGTVYGLNPFNSYLLPNGTPVSFGLSWFNGGSPCSAPLKANGTANPVCNGYFNYSLLQDTDTFIPTEQLNIKSSSLKWLDFNGQYQYSHAHMNTPYTALFSGLETRTSLLGYNTAGSYSQARWNSSSGDVSAVLHVTPKLRLVEAFRFRTFSVEGSFNDLESSFFTGVGGGGVSLLSPVASFPGSILSHSSGSPADIINELSANLVGQNSKQNDFQVQYDITNLFGVRAGFNWARSTIQPGNFYQAALGDIYYPNNANRGNCAGPPLNPDGSCTFVGVISPYGSPTTEINRYTGLLGAWFRKGSALHADIDVQYGGADNWVYRVDPLRTLNVRGNVVYSPRQWLSFSSNLTFERALNSDSDLAYSQHNYLATFGATITPNTRWGIDLGYSFDAIQQNMNICYTGTIVPAGSFTCLGDPTLMEVYNTYHTHTQYGYVAFTATPLERLSLRVGYSIVDNQGNTTSLNSLLPLGPLNSTYQSPLAAADFKVYKDVTFKAAWNYYQYNEGSFVGPTLPRYFHANDTTLALKYAF